MVTFYNIVWLSLMQVTDWLTTLTWLKHNLECSPSPELRRGNIDRYHKMFSLGENFSRKQMATWACATIASKMYVDRPWPRAGCLLRTQYNWYALHCAQLKENPRRKKKLLSYLSIQFNSIWISTSYAETGQGNGEPYNVTDGDFVVWHITECS